MTIDTLLEYTNLESKDALLRKILSLAMEQPDGELDPDAAPDDALGCLLADTVGPMIFRAADAEEETADLVRVVAEASKMSLDASVLDSFQRAASELNAAGIEAQARWLILSGYLDSDYGPAEDAERDE
jgi:hypothetical protein